jgi:hypothetical protein
VGKIKRKYWQLSLKKTSNVIQNRSVSRVFLDSSKVELVLHYSYLIRQGNLSTLKNFWFLK